MIHLDLTQNEFDMILDALEWAEDDRLECYKYDQDKENLTAANTLMVLHAKLDTMEEI